jgi:hypothetical protein
VGVWLQKISDLLVRGRQCADAGRSTWVKFGSGRRALVLFNNCYRDYAQANAQESIELLSDRLF